MICPKCGQEGIEPGDAFCRHCAFSLAEKKPIPAANLDASKGLELFGATMILIVLLFIFAVAPWMGWIEFVSSALPWFSGAITLVGLVMIFIGFGLRRAH